MQDFFSDISGSMMGISLIAIIPFVLIALALLVFALRGRGRAKSAQNWPFVTGTVLHASVETRRSSNGRGGTNISHYPVVVYDYEVQGHRYQGNQLNLGAIGYGNPRTAEAKAAPYLPGNRVNVYYDPNNPGVAVLERTAPSSNLLIWVALLIILILLVSVGATAAAMGAFGGMFGGLFSSLDSVLTQVPK